MEEKIIGIIGGMGPESSADMFLKVLKNDPAKKDQDHLRIIVDCNSKVPNRVSFYQGKGEDPRPYMIKTAQMLEENGCSVLIICCNTAHVWLKDVQDAVNVPILNMMEASSAEVKKDFSDIKKVGLIATPVMYESRMYHEAYKKAGIEVIDPDIEDQKYAMELLVASKAGVTEELKGGMRGVAERLIAKGAEGIICGCTEAPLLLKSGDVDAAVIDPTDSVAKLAVAVARGWAEIS